MEKSENFSQLHEYLRRNDLEGALKWLCQLAPRNARNWYERSRILCTLGRNEEALHAINHALEIEPGKADFLIERGTIYMHLKKFTLAILDMNSAVESNRLNPFPLACRAYLKEHMGQTLEAIEDYKKALELDPSDAILHNNLGLLQEKLGWQEKSKYHFKIADSLASKSLSRAKNPEQNVIKMDNVITPDLIRSNNYAKIICQVITTPKVRKEFLSFLARSLRLWSIKK